MHAIQKKAFDSYRNKGGCGCKKYHFERPWQWMILIAVPPEMLDIVSYAIKRSLIDVGVERIKRLFSFSHLPDSRKKTAGVDMIKISRFLVHDNTHVIAHLNSKRIFNLL